MKFDGSDFWIPISHERYDGTSKVKFCYQRWALVEALTLVLGVMLRRDAVVDDAELGGGQLEATGLEAADDGASQAALDGVGLGDDQGALDVSHWVLLMRVRMRSRGCDRVT